MGGPADGITSVDIGVSESSSTPMGFSLRLSGTGVFYEGEHLEYKYTRGSWTYVEKDAACGEIDNCTATVGYGTDGTMTLNDTVLNWRNTGPCGD